MIGQTQIKAHHGHKVPRKLAQQMQIVDEQIKLACLRRNLTVSKWPIAPLSQKRGSPAGNLSSFDPNFSAVVVQDKNRVARNTEITNLEAWPFVH